MLVMVMVLTQCNVLLEDDELNIYSDDGPGNEGDGNGVGDDVGVGEGDGDGGGDGDDVGVGEGDGGGGGDGDDVTEGNALPEDHPESS